MKIVKTNAMRMLDRNKIPYNIYTYDNEDGQIHGSRVAEKIEQPPEKVFKTLVAIGKTSLYVFVIPVGDELDLKKAAKAAGEKKIEMLPLKELLSHTGYVRGGCSPVAMKKQYPTFIEKKAESQEKIIVSAGKIGLQMEVDPLLLLSCVKGSFASLI